MSDYRPEEFAERLKDLETRIALLEADRTLRPSLSPPQPLPIRVAEAPVARGQNIRFFNTSTSHPISWSAVLVGPGGIVRTTEGFVDVGQGKTIADDLLFEPGTIIYLSFWFNIGGGGTIIQNSGAPVRAFFNAQDGRHVASCGNTMMNHQSGTTRTDDDIAIADGLRHNDWRAYESYLGRHGGVEGQHVGFRIDIDDHGGHYGGYIEVYSDSGDYRIDRFAAP